MKKLMMVAAMLAMVLAVAIPAIAQVNQTFTQNNTSGDVTETGTASSTGNNSSSCAPFEQFGNTGNAENLQGVLQYNSTIGAAGLRFAGSTFSNSPVQVVPCELTVQQAASASSGS